MNRVRKFVGILPLGWALTAMGCNGMQSAVKPDSKNPCKMQYLKFYFLCIIQLGGSFKFGEGREQEVRDLYKSIEAQIT